MATLDIGFDTEFKIPEGRYYETPEGKGKYGIYENKTGNFRASIVDANNGSGYQPYQKDSGKSFYEIEQATGEIDAYCINSADGTSQYGWNPSDENNIEQYMVQSELDRIMPYLSEDAKAFLADTDLLETISIDDNLGILSEIKYAQNQYDMQNDLTTTGVERSER